MPILTKELGNVEVSGSSGRFQPIDTYTSPPPDRGAGDTASQLARSLAQFANVMAGVEQDQKVENEKVFEQGFDAHVASVEKDMEGGLSSLAAAKKLYPQESPVLQNRLAQAAMTNRLERDLYPQWSAIFANQATLTDPKALQAKIDAVKKEYTAKYQNLSDIETAAILNGLNTWEDKVKTAAIDPQAKALYEAGVDSLKKDVSELLMGSQNVVAAASKAVDIDPKFTLAIMKSYNPNGDPNAKNRFQGQTASGLMDITDGTWHYLVDKYGEQYGVTEDMKNDPRGSALMGAAYAKELYDQISAEKGGPATVGEVNGAYMLGFGGFKKLLEAGPDAKMNQVLDSNTFRVNANFFRRKDGSIMTAKEAMAKWENAGVGSGALVPTRRFDGAKPFFMTKETFASSAGYKWTDFKNSGVFGGEGTFDGRLINMLDAVTGQFGHGKLSITSGYRNPKYNNDVSFSGNDGEHTHGTAIDIDVSKYSDEDKKRLIALFVANGARGVGHYANGTIHVDLRSGQGKQSDGLALWYGKKAYTEGASWFAQGVDEGRKMRAEGAVPVSGFNGQGINGFDMLVNKAEAKGMTRKDARDIIFSTLLDRATATRDLSILENIPGGSISLEQQTKLMEAQDQIPKLIASDLQAKDTITQKARSTALESRQTDIMRRFSEGEVLDPNDLAMITYKDADGKDVTTRNDDLFELAYRLNEKDRVDSQTSLAYAMSMRDKLESMYVRNDPSDMFSDIPSIQRLVDASGGVVPNKADINRAILFDTNLNKAEKAELLKALPALEDMYSVVQDKPIVDSMKTMSKNVDLYRNTTAQSAYAKVMSPEVAKLFNELPNDVETVQRDAYLNKYKAWHEDNPGQTIPSLIKLQYVKESESEAKDFFNTRTALIEKKMQEGVTPPDKTKESLNLKPGDVIPGQGTVVAVSPKGVLVTPANGGPKIVLKASDIQKQGPQAPAPVATPVPASQESVEETPQPKAEAPLKMELDMNTVNSIAQQLNLPF